MKGGERFPAKDNRAKSASPRKEGIMFSILRSITVITSNTAPLHAMWKAANPGTANAFVTRQEMPEMHRREWHDGSMLFKSEAIRADADMLQAAWDVLDVFKSEKIADVERIIVKDEYIALTKRGNLDHKSLFQDSITVNAQGNAVSKRTRYTERTNECATVSV